MPLRKKGQARTPEPVRRYPVVEQLNGSIEVGIADFAAGESTSARLTPGEAMAHAAQTLAAVREAIDSRAHHYTDRDLELALEALMGFVAEAGQLGRLIDSIRLELQTSTTHELPKEAMVTPNGKTLFRLVPLDASTKGAIPISKVPIPAVVIGKEGTFGWSETPELRDGLMLRLNRCTVVTPPGVEPFPLDIRAHRGCWAENVTHVVDGNTG